MVNDGGSSEIALQLLSRRWPLKKNGTRQVTKAADQQPVPSFLALVIRDLFFQ